MRGLQKCEHYWPEMGKSGRIMECHGIFGFTIRTQKYIAIGIKTDQRTVKERRVCDDLIHITESGVRTTTDNDEPL
jgi:hypothetical protein